MDYAALKRRSSTVVRAVGMDRAGMKRCACSVLTAVGMDYGRMAYGRGRLSG
jgi:hypothetical protein